MRYHKYDKKKDLEYAMRVFGKLLRDYREKNGYSQSQLADALGISQAQISAMELGDRSPSIGLLYNMAGFFSFDFAEVQARLDVGTVEIVSASISDMETIRKYDCWITEEQMFTYIAKGLVYVLRYKNRVVGSLRYSMFGGMTPFLEWLFIDEAYRNCGFGCQLIAHWEMVMLKRGNHNTMLSMQENESAKYFYGKRGYRCVGSFLLPEQMTESLIYSKELA